MALRREDRAANAAMQFGAMQYALTCRAIGQLAAVFSDSRYRVPMVKKRVGGAQRYAKAASKSGDIDAAPEKQTPPAAASSGRRLPKHLQRKIARKVGFLDRVAATSSVGLTKGSGVSKRKKSKHADVGAALANLSSLGGALDEAGREAAAAADAQRAAGKRVFGEGVKSARARTVIQNSETARMRMVLQHPVFKADPLQAITHHLQARVDRSLIPASSHIYAFVFPCWCRPSAPSCPLHCRAAAGHAATTTTQGSRGEQQEGCSRGPWCTSKQGPEEKAGKAAEAAC